jgi:serine phosphatase RsbU (regulator of sigma subunit)
VKYDDRQHEILEAELKNFVEITKQIKPHPGLIPHINNIELFGGVAPLNGIAGGDHLIYIDFNERYDLDALAAKARAEGKKRADGKGSLADTLLTNKRRAGILLADVMGHQATDAAVSCMLHHAFLTGALYEMHFFGEITTKLIENLNMRFYSSSSIRKFVTMVYGEISDEGRFRFIVAGHPLPVVFSREYGRFVNIGREHMTTFMPIGAQPSDGHLETVEQFSPLGRKRRYKVNELHLMGKGDILLLYTDGLSELADGRYFPSELEKLVAKESHLSARGLYEAVMHDVKRFETEDDISLVVIKRT